MRSFCHVAVVAVQRAAQFDHGFDVRTLAQHGGIDPPHARESRIEQAYAPVAAEHRERLGQVVEGLALHVDQRVEAAFEVEPLGHVVEQIGGAAVGMRRGHDAQGAPVGEVPFMRHRVARAVGRVELRLPLAEVLLLGQLAVVAQTVEHRGVGRPLVEKAGIEVPQRAVGGIVEGELLVGAEDGDAGRKLVERAAMRLAQARELGAQALDVGRIDADAGTAAWGRHLEQIQIAAAAGDDDGQADHRAAPRRGCAFELRARRMVDKLTAERHRAQPVGCLDRTRIGRIGEYELSGGVAHPYRRGQRLDQEPQRIGLGLERIVGRIELGELALDPGHVAQFKHRAARDGTALGLDLPPRGGRQRPAEAFAIGAQFLDGA